MVRKRDPSKLERKERAQDLPSCDRSLLTWDEIPSWQQDNEYIRSGYRRATASFPRCFQSLRYVHNETINIYSHLLGAIIFLFLPISTFYSRFIRYPSASDADVIVFCTFFYGVAICFLLSATYHIITNHSPKVQKIGNQLDYLGIVILMWGSTVPSIYYGLYCDPNLQKIYWTNVSILAILCITATLHPRFRHPTIRPYRAIMYAALGLSAVAFVTHGVLIHGLDVQTKRMSLMWMALMAGLNLIGAVLYAIRFPEKYSLGQHDIYGSSHQILHVAVILAALAHFCGLLEAFDYLHTHGFKCYITSLYLTDPLLHSYVFNTIHQAAAREAAIGGEMACTEFRFVSQGAIVQAFPLAGSNIVLGFPDPQLYRAHNEPYFGETIGRVANRINNAEIRVGQDLKYSLAQNDGPNCLHGGWQGWGKKPFQGPFEVIRDGRQALHFLLVSVDGDEGFPGTLECRVWYFTKTSAFLSELEIEYEVEFIGSECDETIVALTNHSYFNLNPGSTTIGGTQVKLGTDWQLQADDQHIPTGDFSKFDEGTAFTVENATPEIDACFIMDPDDETFALDTRGRPYRRLIQLHHPATNFNLEVLSTEPAFQLYTGDGIDVPALPLADGQMCPAMGPRSGIAIEPCRYVDAQRRKWRAQCSIKPGERWGSRTFFRAWKDIE